MKQWILVGISLVLGLTAPGGQTWAQQNCGDPPDVLILLDRSLSMSSTVGTQSKWAHAKDAVNQMVSTYEGMIRFGLMLFPGPQANVDICDPGVVEVDVADSTQTSIATALSASFPDGNTPIADTLDNALGHLNGIDPAKTKYVLLVTDGQETCSGDPVSAVTPLASAQVKTYVVGFGDGVDPTQLDSMAQAGGTALAADPSYYQADSPAQLSQALQAIGSFVSCCGNGELDDGEICDPGIAPGDSGACPTQCDDGFTCTVDAPTGDNCDVTCAFTPILDPQDDDQCCPPGATSLEDNDCPPQCGNGLLEAGESCDPGIDSGAGACITVADCEDDDPCTEETLGGTACDISCLITATEPDPDNADGCCPEGNSLTEDADCLPECGPDVHEGTCVDLCQDVECPDGQYCSSGECVPWPEGDSSETEERSEPASNPDEGEEQRPGIEFGQGCACNAPGDSTVQTAALGATALLSSWLLLGLVLGLLWAGYRLGRRSRGKRVRRRTLRHVPIKLRRLRRSCIDGAGQFIKSDVSRSIRLK
jgi:hypothetical protein